LGGVIIGNNEEMREKWREVKKERGNKTKI